MASSVSGQDQPNYICDWLPGQAKWSYMYLVRLGLPAVSREKKNNSLKVSQMIILY